MATVNTRSARRTASRAGAPGRRPPGGWPCTRQSPGPVLIAVVRGLAFAGGAPEGSLARVPPPPAHAAVTAASTG
jgi:hypothetical protein